jgi:dolichol-phosphate mannosyltransferase
VLFYKNNFAIVTPMANEEQEFDEFTTALATELDKLQCGKVYMIIDNVTKDNTLALARTLSARDDRFVTVWAPENRSIVDAYLRGYREALQHGHDIVIEMDAGLSHDPRAVPMFLRVLNEGNECAFGSRFINGGSIYKSNFRRTFLSKIGTYLSNILLGSTMHDMTSGYQGFHANVVTEFLAYPLKSTAHFYQTELRYLLRKKRFAEIPIHYRAPSPSVSEKAIKNSLSTLWYYFKLRLAGKAALIE